MAPQRKNNPEKLNGLTWAVKCRGCTRYSRYDEYYQKPKWHSGKVAQQAAHATCPRCGAENDYRSGDLELIANELLNSSPT